MVNTVNLDGVRFDRDKVVTVSIERAKLRFLSYLVTLGFVTMCLLTTGLLGLSSYGDNVWILAIIINIVFLGLIARSFRSPYLSIALSSLYIFFILVIGGVWGLWSIAEPRTIFGLASCFFAYHCISSWLFSKTHLVVVRFSDGSKKVFGRYFEKTAQIVSEYLSEPDRALPSVRKRITPGTFKGTKFGPALEILEGGTVLAWHVRQSALLNKVIVGGLALVTVWAIILLLEGLSTGFETDLIQTVMSVAIVSYGWYSLYNSGGNHAAINVIGTNNGAIYDIVAFSGWPDDVRYNKELLEGLLAPSN